MTISEEMLSKHLKSKDGRNILELTEFEEAGSSFEEDGETYYVFALLPEHYKNDIEAAIVKAGGKFKWL